MTSTLHFFTIPALASSAAEVALNQFLASHRVLAVEKQWLSAGENSAWAVCATVLHGQPALPAHAKLPTAKGDKGDKAEFVDYKTILNPADFALYLQLRELRKNTAASEGVPPYVVFTNAQLAAMASSRPDSETALRTIDGIGQARSDKYAAPFLQVLQAHTPASENA